MKNILLTLSAVALLTSCNPAPKTVIKSDMNLASQIEYGDKTANKVVFESNAYKMILFAMKSDQVLKPHSAPMDAPLYMIEGSAKITIGKKEHTVVAGDLINLPKDIDHGVYPITDCKFLLAK
ncbi:MAG: cupin domain-containing protein [Nonlabens sp.]|uniref:cupin domain-containing protein n=1 Tax=Nonlabens sp. TaxID=1888209 RepID=UPI003EF7AC97